MAEELTNRLALSNNTYAGQEISMGTGKVNHLKPGNS